MPAQNVLPAITLPASPRIMRPPAEAHSLLAPITEGCSWNACRYCSIGSGRSANPVSLESCRLFAELSREHFPPDTKIYLAGPNPFYLPANRLWEYLKIIRSCYPRAVQISMQARIPDIAAKTDMDLAILRNLGLSHLYVGADNGSDAVLKFMRKGYDGNDILFQLQRLANAGISYTLFYVLGLGGQGKWHETAAATLECFNRAQPRAVSTTALTIFANTQLAGLKKKGDFEPAPEREIIQELRQFLSGLEIPCVYDGRHYTNPLAYYFHTRDLAAKSAALKDIDETLSEYSDPELELMVNRKAMQSL